MSLLYGFLLEPAAVGPPWLGLTGRMTLCVIQCRAGKGLDNRAKVQLNYRARVQVDQRPHIALKPLEKRRPGCKVVRFQEPEATMLSRQGTIESCLGEEDQEAGGQGKEQEKGQYVEVR